MGIFTFLLITFIVLLLILIYSIFNEYFTNKKQNERQDYFDTSLSLEELERHAKITACEQTSIKKHSGFFRWLLRGLKSNHRYIYFVYKNLNDNSKRLRGVSPAAEWLLDNYYIIEEQVKNIKKDLKRKNYSKLPTLKNSALAGYPRVYAIATQLVSHTDGKIEAKLIEEYLKAYQSVNVLTENELWAVSLMIRIALIENIRTACNKIEAARIQHEKVDIIFENVDINEAKELERLKYSINSYLKTLNQPDSSFIEHLAYRLRRVGKSSSVILRQIDFYLTRLGMDIETLTQQEHSIQALNKMKIENCILSLKYISSLDWIDIFENISHVEAILQKDPMGVYALMDIESKSLYRKKIEAFAKRFNVSEVHVANCVYKLAEENADTKTKQSHVGYYLIDRGNEKLEENIALKHTESYGLLYMLIKRPKILYFGLIIFLISFITVTLSLYTFYNTINHSIVLTIITALILLIPSSEASILLVNKIVGIIYKPAILPKLNFNESIPDDSSTMIVIPTLLSSKKRVDEMIKNLELHYLANKNENLYFSISGDFKDGNNEYEKSDNEIIETGLKSIEILNKKYSLIDKPIFYFFHRKREYNNKQGKWMGKERKRGALVEFNRLLKGDNDTTYIYNSCEISNIPKIKYVITLDADTMMNIDTAKKLIGAMAHPLNKPLVNEDKTAVIEGYCLMQPRINFDIESVNASLFSRIFSGGEGIDPYSGAVSDVYQDLFGEGIFTGKGIYELDTFKEITNDIIADNSILSHDLLEGSLVRTGLLTDVEFIDSYPSKYSSFAMRLHRWVRGDWQLLPWLKSTIINNKGEKVKNPLSFISKWKLIDNLRRSLLAPTLIIFNLLIFSVLPGNYWFWTIIFLAAAFAPLLVNIPNLLIFKNLKHLTSKTYIPMITGLKGIFLQVLFLFIFLPYQAYSMINAISITLYRLFVSKKNLLEWITAADAEKGSEASYTSYLNRMAPSMIFGAISFSFSIIFKPESTVLTFVFFIIWIFAPMAAYRISLPTVYNETIISVADKRILRVIARKTWSYFEDFLNSSNNFLPPDNFQVIPTNGVAHRTSPTNIGLSLMSILTARDMGYISTKRMAEMLCNTMKTIEKLEKWNGHLFNWYDTRTLRLLRPRYISTVDSGNFVCYLLTVSSGIEEYLQNPLVSPNFTEAFIDTFTIDKMDNNVFSKCTSLLNEVIPRTTIAYTQQKEFQVNIIQFYKTLGVIAEILSNYAMSAKIKKYKVLQMVLRQRTELSIYMDWLSLPEIYENTTESITAECNLNYETVNIIKEIIGNLNSNASPSHLRDKYVLAIEKINILIQSYSDSGINEQNQKIFDYLNKILASLNLSLSNIKLQISDIENLSSIMRKEANDTHFYHLYNKKRHLFSIGFNIEENKLTNSYYDLLASEARMAFYIAVATHDVEKENWARLGRILTVLDGYKGLVSWSGTMFEYLMPMLIMKSYKNTLLDETHSFAVVSQKKYGKSNQIPWGSSESSFYAMDINMDYQYKAFGVPWLGLKRGLSEDLVVSPYSSLLAMMVEPRSAIKNIKTLIKLGAASGPYGLYESLDFTPERVPFGLKYAIVKSYMVHHIGMGFIATNNILNSNCMQERFYRNPIIESAKYLLQEKIPHNVVYAKENKEKFTRQKTVTQKTPDEFRYYDSPNPILPKTHFLSNGDYTLMLTDTGSGFSKTKKYNVTRWRTDPCIHHHGMFFYIKNVDTNDLWMNSYEPNIKLPDRYSVCFSSDKVIYKRLDKHIETKTEITVCSEDNTEIRSIKLTNRSKNDTILEITEYFEAVLCEAGTDLSHPVFNNLFIRTEFWPEHSCIIAYRKPRSDKEKDIYMINKVIVDRNTSIGNVECETDRSQFLGRNRTIANPLIMETNRPLSGTVGAVIDPSISLRQKIKVPGGGSTRITFIISVSDTIEGVMEMLSKYSTNDTVERSFSLALTRTNLELSYLNLKASDIRLYQELMSQIIFVGASRRLKHEYMAFNKRGQSNLWSYGISGDLPIITVEIMKNEHLDILYNTIKAHEYWRLKGLSVDVIVLNDEENSYTHKLQAIIYDIVSSSHAHELINKKGGIFLLNANNIAEEDKTFLFSVSCILFRGNNGSMEEQAKTFVTSSESNPYVKDCRNIKKYLPNSFDKFNKPLDLEAIKKDLLYFNDYGGFTKDNKEYIILLENNKSTPMPWINVISNPKFGFLATESGGGYTWCENSREFKLTPWVNDPLTDTIGEAIYIWDSNHGVLSSPCPAPLYKNIPHIIRHGYGYTSYEHVDIGLSQKLLQFVPIEHNVKINLLTVKNMTDETRSLNIFSYYRTVLGVSDEYTSNYIYNRLSERGTIFTENKYNTGFQDFIVFANCSKDNKTFTCDRKEFLGDSGLKSPAAVNNEKLSNTTGGGLNPCIAIQTQIELQPNEEKDIIFILGCCKSFDEGEELVRMFKDISVVNTEFEKIKAYWNNTLTVLEVETPNVSANLFLNKRLLYQTICCRLWARTAFYQCGGAYGFRDQLQDVLTLCYINPEITRSQILLSSSRQFIEGDVLHWWHENPCKGTRTRFSDDFLWLPYTVTEYINITGNSDILNEKTTYVKHAMLKEYEDEIYVTPEISTESETIYEHCIRAIDRSLKSGRNGLPLMGSGDWNDGMNTVGNKGLGESVWLAWFLYDVLQRFIPVCISMHDNIRADTYKKAAEKYAEAANKNAWDGLWFRRAFFDNGTPLGSIENKECKIDSLSQSWSIISGGGDKDKTLTAIESAENYLVNHEQGIIKLLTPPFDDGDLEPGYIKSYIPGVRENGGQYTHAAAWFVMAFAIIGNGEKAWELYDMINPIQHTLTPSECLKYKVEPYALAADVYTLDAHIGRGGWTWYTGSSGWIYKVGMEYLLGIRKRGDTLAFYPCIPKKWNEYKVKYTLNNTVYVIKFLNPNNKNTGVISVSLDGITSNNNFIVLSDDSISHNVVVIIG